jgi:plasmid stabilization system protein ParE
MKVVYAERARRDIEDIYESIAPHNPTAAQRVEDLIRTTCEGLADFPLPRQRPTSLTCGVFRLCAFPTPSSI